MMGDRKKPSTRTLPPKLTRRSHTKSRTGCNPCKARRVKCDEGQPFCGNCQAKGLSCDYPSRIVSHNPFPPPAPAASKPEIVQISTTFSSKDFQAFHCYLLFGSPSLPLGNGSAWLQDIPQIAHEHDYLMQGILALGASHLWRSTSDDSFHQLSLKHRCRAIAGLKTALAEADSWQANGQVDAMLGTCYALTSQAAHMPDGIQDYLTLVNGCKLITERVREDNLRSAFDVALDRPYRTLGPGLRSILGESSDEGLIQEGLTALSSLEDLMVLPAEKEFLTAVKNILRAFQAGAYEGYLMDIATYGMWYQLAGEHLRSFHESDPTPTKLMLAHLLGISCLLRILIPIRRWPKNVLSTAPRQKLTEARQWIAAFQSNLPEELRPYIQWPVSIMARLPAVMTTLSPSSKPIGLPPHMKSKMLQEMHTCLHVVLWDILTLCADLTAWFEEMLLRTIDQHKQLRFWQNSDTTDNEQSISLAIEASTTPYFENQAMSDQFIFSDQTEAMVMDDGFSPFKVED